MDSAGLFAGKFKLFIIALIIVHYLNWLELFTLENGCWLLDHLHGTLGSWEHWVRSLGGWRLLAIKLCFGYWAIQDCSLSVWVCSLCYLVLFIHKLEHGIRQWMKGEEMSHWNKMHWCTNKVFFLFFLVPFGLFSQQ